LITQKAIKTPSDGNFSKAGHEMNVQKSVALLYNNNELAEKKVRKIIPLMIAS
jgi:hypothetical protein